MSCAKRHESMSLHFTFFTIRREHDLPNYPETFNERASKEKRGKKNNISVILNKAREKRGEIIMINNESNPKRERNA